jgi:hypothetical protein
MKAVEAVAAAEMNWRRETAPPRLISFSFVVGVIGSDA